MNLESANQYFASRLSSQAWTQAPDSQKLQALSQAERQLSSYLGRVPGLAYTYAVCEQAVWLLGADLRAKLQQAGVSDTSMGKVAETFNMGGRDPHIAPDAWFYLRGPGMVKGGGLA